MLKKKSFPPFQKLLDIYTVFPYFDEAVIFLSGVPVLPLPSVRGRESLFIYLFLYDSHFSSVPTMNSELTEAVRTVCDRPAME